MVLRPRRLMRRLHLWLGLSVGLVFLILGASGSALVFYIELDRLLHPVIDRPSGEIAPGWTSPIWDRALATAQATWPGENGKWSFEVNGQTGAIPGRYYAPDDRDGFQSYPLMLWFQPDGSAVVRADRWGRYLMTWFYDLHRHLLAGDAGRRIAGWSGLAILVLLGTGLAAWWPRGKWRKALSFKRNAAPIRRLHDIHKLAGLWSLAVLLVLVATGSLLALPEERNLLLAWAVQPIDPIPAPASATSNGQRISISMALAQAHQAIPDARLAWIDVPGPGAGTFRIRVQVPGDPNRRFPGSNIFIDQYSGAILAVHDVRSGNTATTISNWIRPFHDASIGGLATRLLAVITGLIPAALLITGILHWRRRRASARLRRN